MWYLLGAGASEEEPTVGLPWVAAVVNRVAATVGVAEATTAVVGAAEAIEAAVGATVVAEAAAVGVMRDAAATAAVAGGLVTGGGEELCTLGRKACPPRVFTMFRPDEERRWRAEFQTGNGD